MTGPDIIQDTRHDRPKGCSAETTLEFLSGKWRPMIIYWLLQGTRRFNQLQRDLGAITHRTLSKTLKEMEADGLIARTDHGEIPPRVDYSLTEKGESLEPVLTAMAKWAEKHHAAPGRADGG
ncbi:MAG TPA: helix-turn-helix domain-containing protein [Kiloniellaceae bacterium]